MTWGCKAANHPNGCGWASRLTYTFAGWQEWWCDTCERAGDMAVAPSDSPSRPRATPDPAPPHTGPDARYPPEAS